VPKDTIHFTLHDGDTPGKQQDELAGSISHIRTRTWPTDTERGERKGGREEKERKLKRT